MTLGVTLSLAWGPTGDALMFTRGFEESWRIVLLTQDGSSWNEMFRGNRSNHKALLVKIPDP